MPVSGGFPISLPARVRWRRLQAFGSTRVLTRRLTTPVLRSSSTLPLCLLSHSGVVFATSLALAWGTPRRSSRFATLDPMGGIVAFAVALLALALSCLFTKSRSLPLLPFLVPIFAIIEVVGCTL